MRNEKFDYLKKFWSKLIFDPSYFPQNQDTLISEIIGDQKEILASKIIRSTLAKNLDLPLNSALLTDAILHTSSIFHEDYPYDFILVYKGERLGMMVLDFCRDSNNEVVPEYKFNPHLKNFKGVF